jgi:hypothetical protein
MLFKSEAGDYSTVVMKRLAWKCWRRAGERPGRGRSVGRAQENAREV